jgi:hypothetical protein
VGGKKLPSACCCCWLLQSPDQLPPSARQQPSSPAAQPATASSQQPASGWLHRHRLHGAPFLPRLPPALPSLPPTAARSWARMAAKSGRFGVRIAYRPLVGQPNAFGGGNHASTAGGCGGSVVPVTEASAASAALLAWHATGDRQHRCALLDLRSKAEFARLHVDGSTSLPWGDDGQAFIARAHELPPRGAELSLLADGEAEVRPWCRWQAVAAAGGTDTPAPGCGTLAPTVHVRYRRPASI